MIADDRHGPEEVAEDDDARRPDDAAENAEEREHRVAHPAEARDKRRQCAHDPDEPTEEHGQRTEPVEEAVRPLDVGRSDCAHQTALEHSAAEPSTDQESTLVAEDRGQRNQHTQQPERGERFRLSRKDARGEQNRVAGEHETDEQARFDEDQQAQSDEPARGQKRVEVERIHYPQAYRHPGASDVVEPTRLRSR